ncbi:hypothetical protein ANO11243_088920 [Dothideomycetidae sp. 11243]|nr:hypothetical protein ANO11243_088920 [fungal sp. No.11243]
MSDIKRSLLAIFFASRIGTNQFSVLTTAHSSPYRLYKNHDYTVRAVLLYVVQIFNLLSLLLIWYGTYITFFKKKSSAGRVWAFTGALVGLTICLIFYPGIENVHYSILCGSAYGGRVPDFYDQWNNRTPSDITKDADTCSGKKVPNDSESTLAGQKRAEEESSQTRPPTLFAILALAWTASQICISVDEWAAKRPPGLYDWTTLVGLTITRITLHLSVVTLISWLSTWPLASALENIHKAQTRIPGVSFFCLAQIYCLYPLIIFWGSSLWVSVPNNIPYVRKWALAGALANFVFIHIVFSSPSPEYMNYAALIGFVGTAFDASILFSQEIDKAGLTKEKTSEDDSTSATDSDSNYFIADARAFLVIWLMLVPVLWVCASLGKWATARSTPEGLKTKEAELHWLTYFWLVLFLLQLACYLYGARTLKRELTWAATGGAAFVVLLFMNTVDPSWEVCIVYASLTVLVMQLYSALGFFTGLSGPATGFAYPKEKCDTCHKDKA